MAPLSTSQSRKTRMPIARALSSVRTAGDSPRIRPTGRPMKMVAPAIAPRPRMPAVLMQVLPTGLTKVDLTRVPRGYTTARLHKQRVAHLDRPDLRQREPCPLQHSPGRQVV